MPSDLGTIILIIVLLGGVGLSQYFFVSRSQRLVAKWAADNGYELLSAQVTFFRRGPYFWSSKAQSVYRVKVRDRSGIEREGWVRCGSWLGGVFTGAVEGQLED